MRSPRARSTRRWRTPRSSSRARVQKAADTSFITAFNEILLIAAAVALVGAVLGFLMVRKRDFVGWAPAAEAPQPPEGAPSPSPPAERPPRGANPSRRAAISGGVLHELRIENLLLIERAELRLEPGLNAITGETGAGKTVLAHSLDLLLGGRARPQIVRPGAAEAYVEGVFSVPDGLLDDPELAELRERLPEDAEEVVLGRRIGASGRTSAFIQGRSAAAADLQALGSRLLAFYGQHEHRRLMLASAQLEILDSFAGPEHLRAPPRVRARPTPRSAALAPGARRAARARGCAGARPRSPALRARRDRGGGARRRASSPSSRPSASACATPRACAQRPPGRSRRSPIRTRRAMRPAPWPRPPGRLARWRASTRRSTS